MRWLLVCVVLGLGAEARGEALATVEPDVERARPRPKKPPKPAIRIYRPGANATVTRATLDVWLREDRAVAQLTLEVAGQTHGGVTPDTAFAGDLQDAQVHACLRDEVASWQFGPTDSTTEVNYPLTFRLTE